MMERYFMQYSNKRREEKIQTCIIDFVCVYVCFCCVYVYVTYVCVVSFNHFVLFYSFLPPHSPPPPPLRTQLGDCPYINTRTVIGVCNRILQVVLRS